MNKQLLIILCCWFTVTGSYAQTHYKGSINIETGIGVNDLGCISPVIGAGYTFNNLIAAYARYSFASGNRPGLSFTEHNFECYAAFSPLNFNEKIFFSFQPGAIVKLQYYNDLIPSTGTGQVNIGLMADIETEWATGIYWSLFGRVSFRSLLLEDNIRFEMFYNAGIRLSLNIFNAAEHRLLPPVAKKRKH